MDVLKLPKCSSRNQYAVVFVDYLTKWPEVFATKDQTALTSAKLFVEEVVSRHGVPSQLLSDRGQAFLSKLMGEVCEVLLHITRKRMGSSSVLTVLSPTC